MTDPKHKRFQAMLQPYVFVLQEGAEIQSNPFDYKLRMLHTNCREVIKQPKGLVFKTNHFHAPRNVRPIPTSLPRWDHQSSGNKGL